MSVRLRVPRSKASAPKRRPGFILIDNGYLRLVVRYLQTRKRNGAISYNYYRRIPEEFQGEYGRVFIREALKTKDPKEAARLAGEKAARDDILWKTWKTGEAPTAPKDVKISAEALLKEWGLTPGGGGGEVWQDDPRDHLLDKYGEALYALELLPSGRQREEAISGLLTPVEREAWRLAFETSGKRDITVSDALEVYLDTHQKGKHLPFIKTTNISIRHVLESVGDLPLRSFDRAKARQVMHDIAKEGRATGTVRRRLRSISAVWNKAILEFELKDVSNPFHKLDIIGEGLDTKHKVTFSASELEVISQACRAKNDHIRQIAALQLDTGARLAEIVGLRIEDIFQDHPIPHIWIREQRSLGRTLKTPGSNRKVPLLGVSLWAARQALSAASSRLGWLFPQYAKDHNINANGASAAINKWLQGSLKGTGRTAKATTHCFRHTMKDRLRAARVPEDIQKAILGHCTRSVADGYGQGYPLEVLEENLRKVVLEQP